jgi:hypothetical protein
MAYAAPTNLATGDVAPEAWFDAVTNDFAAMFPVVAPDAAWATWAPTLANITVGNGTTTARYFKLGRLVWFDLKFVMGSTSAMGTNPTYTLPVTAAARYVANEVVGSISVLDSGTANFPGLSLLSSTTVAVLQVGNAAGTYVTATGFTATAPMTWTTSDMFSVKGFYEAAS